MKECLGRTPTKRYESPIQDNSPTCSFLKLKQLGERKTNERNKQTFPLAPPRSDVQHYQPAAALLHTSTRPDGPLSSGHDRAQVSQPPRTVCHDTPQHPVGGGGPTYQLCSAKRIVRRHGGRISDFFFFLLIITPNNNNNM